MNRLWLYAMIVIAVASPTAAQRVFVRGSDTMLILNQRWSEVYAKVNPRISVVVSGGGSAIGIEAFTSGETDICASSRPMRKSEVDRARERGIVANEIPVAIDGLAVVVNASNPVQSLTLDQLRRIYLGEITNWSQVGGPNLPIVVFSRDSYSGTYDFFRQKVLRNRNWGAGVRFLPSTGAESREVARTPGGIAYGGVAYFKNRPEVKIVPISPRAGEPPVYPDEKNVRSKRYPIWRYLYFYTNGKPRGAVKEFNDWVLSPDGQRVAEEVGYYSLRPL